MGCEQDLCVIGERGRLRRLPVQRPAAGWRAGRPLLRLRAVLVATERGTKRDALALLRCQEGDW